MPGPLNLAGVAESYARVAAARLARFAVGDNAGQLEAFEGRGFDDAVYKGVTEGRQDEAHRLGIFYSSCGDLPHWMLCRLGVRLPWVNRREMMQLAPPHPGWRVGQNLSALVSGSGLAERVTPDAARFEPGDVLHLGDTNASAHVDVVLADLDGEDGRAIVSADYGLPAAGIRRSFAHVEGGRLFRNKRPIVHVLRLGRVLSAARDAGLLVEASFPSGMAANDNASA